MKKTLNINLGGFIFHIDEDAYFRLDKYLNTLKAQFAKAEGGREIVSDIEMRIAELFKERTGSAKEVISLADVDRVIEIMGQPEDYLGAEDEETQKAPEEEYTFRKKRIFRDPDNRVVAGVSSGLAAYFNTDPIWMRVVFLLLFFFSGFGLLLYIIMWLIIPKASTTAEKLQMRGEKVNISTIEKSIKDEMKGFGDRVSSYNYKKSGNALSSFFQDLGNFIADAFRLIFRVLGKLIGLFFLMIGFLILFALGVGLFAGGVEILGSGYDMSDLFEFLQLVSVSEGHYNLLVAGVVLSIIAPFFLLVYLGIRLLFNLEPLNKPTRSALVLTTVLGLIFLIVSGVKIGLQFDSHSEVKSEIALPPAKHFTLRLQEDSITRKYMESYAPQWIHDGDINAFNYVDVEIEQTFEEKPYITLRVESNGRDRREARLSARQIRYKVDIQDSTIYVPYYYILDEGQKFRGQEVNLILYLPEGYSVFIDQPVAEILDDIANLQNRWDFEMGNERWIMTADGLSCEGCPIPEKEVEDYESESDTDNSDESLEIEINEDGMRMEIREKDRDTIKREMKFSNLSGMKDTLLPFQNNLVAVI